jgi:hypothetical protein
MYAGDEAVNTGLDVVPFDQVVSNFRAGPEARSHVFEAAANAEDE